MPEYHVGLNLEERFENPPTIEGVPVSIGAMVIRQKKGTMNKAIFNSSWEEFERKTGGFHGGFAGPKHARGYFVNEGKALWTSRVLRPEVLALLQTGAADYALDWIARHPGAWSNNINVILTDPGGASSALSVTVTKTAAGYDIDVSLETDGTSTIVSTANEVLALVNADLDALKLVVVSLTSGSDGTGTMVAETTAPLVGGLGPATADGWFLDSDKLGHSVKVAAANPGDWGNSLKVTTQKAGTTLKTQATAVPTTEIEVVSVRDFEVGDLIILDDGTNLDYFVVHTVTPATNKLGFVSKTPSAYAVGTPVKTVTVHALSTTITTLLATGANQTTLVNAIGARKGSLIHINDGTTETTVLVTAVSGNTIFFSPVTLGASIAANSPATSFEFNMVFEDEVGAYEESPGKQLSMLPTNALNYVNFRLSGVSNQSDLVEVADQNPSNSPAYLDLPYPVAAVALEFGLDGETPIAADYMGVSTPGAETGIYRFKGIKEISMIATPGQTGKTVVENGFAFCDAELHPMYISAVPQAVDTVEEAIEHRDYTIPGSTMRGTMYFPWLKIYDPESDYTLLQEHSPEGWVMGVWSRVAASRGVHKAPANERILGIAGLVTDDKTTDWDNASLFLNPRGVNIIREFPGYGIRVFGARTLLKEGKPQQFIHVVRTTIYNEQSILGDSLWTAFEPTDEDLRDDVQDMIREFFYNQWEDGVFVPADNPDMAFYVYAGSGINPAAQLAAGIFKVKFGANVVGTAEKVVFIMTNMRGQRSIEEQ